MFYNRKWDSKAGVEAGKDKGFNFHMCNLKLNMTSLGFGIT